MIYPCIGFPGPPAYHTLQNPLRFTMGASPSSPSLFLLLITFFWESRSWNRPISFSSLGFAEIVSNFGCYAFPFPLPLISQLILLCVTSWFSFFRVSFNDRQKEKVRLTNLPKLASS